MSPGQIAQYLKGGSSHLFQDEFSEIRKNIEDSICGREVTFVEQWDKWRKRPSRCDTQRIFLLIILQVCRKARQKNLCKRREAVVKETGANQRISQAGHSPA